MDFTRLVRPWLLRCARQHQEAARECASTQRELLRSLLRRGVSSEPGRRYDFRELAGLRDPYPEFARRVPMHAYEDIRADVLRMVAGEKDVLWPGVCRSYAQSSGTSGGRSKYIPVTADSLRRCHYAGAEATLAFYLQMNPASRILSGKAFILGGSFASELKPDDPRVRIGDLSATLISRMTPLAGMYRIPNRDIALMADWNQKLPALVKASQYQDVTNISGVPSWFLTVIKEVMRSRGADRICDVWPNLEVFFHGGISFEPYREIYQEITDPKKMHFVETYNASEGFFATQSGPEERSMLLLMDCDVFYEFLDIMDPAAVPVTADNLVTGKVYELLITSSNGLWRYHLGDTVKVVSVNPVKIVIAGRTRTFINAFGEELMEENAERAIAEACRRTGAEIANYTAAPVYATGKTRGRHQWLIEWSAPPGDIKRFAQVLHDTLRSLNSDYAAKTEGRIFLDSPEIISLPTGSFDAWLRSVGSGKLGGQRKVPRLSNDRNIADALLRQLKTERH